MKIVYFVLAGILVAAVLLLPIFLIIFAQPAGYTLLPAFRDAAIIYASFFMCVGAILFIVMTGLIALIAFTVRDKIAPALDKVDDTMKTVRGTTTFISESVVAPIIKVAGAAAGTRATLQSLMRPKPKKANKADKEDKSE